MNANIFSPLDAAGTDGALGHSDEEIVSCLWVASARLRRRGLVLRKLIVSHLFVNYKSPAPH